MSFFHRPGASSSEEDSSSEEEELENSLNDQPEDSAKDSVGTTEEVVGQLLTPTETLSLTNSIGEDGAVVTIDEHRNMMLASMLEELSKYKAAEMLNNANAGNGRIFDKSSPEVEDIARAFFASSSGMLNNSGLLPAAVISEEKKMLRQQYMAGLERWSYQNAVDGQRRESGDRGRGSVPNNERALVRRQSQQPTPFMGTTAGQIQQFSWETSQIDVVRRPSAELRLGTHYPVRVRSHYNSHFEERGLLGRGGFGRVYRTYNILDSKEYAIKKIPLSPRLSQRYQEGGHAELANILREVQALASLDHCNVVRYYGTWIEEPVALPRMPARPKVLRATYSFKKPLLLDNKSAHLMPPPRDRFRATSENDESADLFERSGANTDRQLWSHQNAQTPSVSEAGDSNPFSDGCSHLNQYGVPSQLDDPTVYVLHVQMSMYPMTLSEYLLPPSSPRKSSGNIRHCFHLVPALKILLTILSGLQYIHAAGFIHRDIKPSNIFLSHLDFASPLAFSEGYADTGSCLSCPYSSPRYLNPRIGDFGLVADLEKVAGGGSSHSRSHSDNTPKPVGTEYYRPPQQGKSPDMAIDEKVDVFALGVILLELLCACGTRMERIELLQGAQKGLVPSGLTRILEKEKFTGQVVEMTKRLIGGMIETDSRTRWRCGMVKSGIEGILATIAGQIEKTREVPD